MFVAPPGTRRHLQLDARQLREARPHCVAEPARAAITWTWGCPQAKWTVSLDP